MGLRDLHLKLLKAFRLKRFLLGNRGKKRGHRSTKKPSWMMPLSHGYHVVEHHMLKGAADDSDFDSVVVQRKQMDHTELWYFGIFDTVIGDRVTKYMQSHFFNRKLKESRIKRKSKETLKRAYLGARGKIREAHKSEDTFRMGSASALVINGDKLVLANIGDYRAVVCRDGMAHQTATRHQESPKRHWPRRLFSGNAAGTRRSKGSDLVIGAQRIDSSTEFLILASNGIWEVMKNQEAVNLIRHMEDPQEAAEWLVKEALIRMSKSNISCLIIRFD